MYPNKTDKVSTPPLNFEEMKDIPKVLKDNKASGVDGTPKNKEMKIYAEVMAKKYNMCVRVSH